MTNAVVLVDDPSADGVMAAWRKLKRYIMTSGFHAEAKRHEFAMTKSQRRRLKAKRARKRERKGKHYWTAARLQFLDRHGLSDQSEGGAPYRGRGQSAVAGAPARQPAQAVTETAARHSLHPSH